MKFRPLCLFIWPCIQATEENCRKLPKSAENCRKLPKIKKVFNLDDDVSGMEKRSFFSDTDIVILFQVFVKWLGTQLWNVGGACFQK